MIGQTLGHCRIVEQVGAGGMGVVYRARDTRLDRDVALKLLPAGALSDEAARRRFRNEALALSKLSHPNIATVFDFDSEGGVDFLVMEYISGIILSEQLRAGALPEKDVVALAAQIAAALEEAHEHGIVHCDLKPSQRCRDIEGSRQGARLRPGADLASRRGCGSDRDHARYGRRRHAPVHGTRGVARRTGRRAQRHLVAGRDALRDARGQAFLPGGNAIRAGLADS